MRALVAVALAFVAGCSRAPVDPVAALLAELEAAAEARDAGRFADRLAPAFHSARGLGRTEALAELRRYLAAYESVAVDVYGVETERDGSAARVRCVVELSGRARQVFGLEGLLPPSGAYRFDLDVADEGGTWRVRGATWEPAERRQEDARPRGTEQFE
jgi:hypothetical protein